MRRDYPRGSGTVAGINGHPLHPMLIPFPIAFLVAAPLTDITFLVTDNSFWATASFWLILAGVVTGLIAAVAGLVEAIGVPRARSLRTTWMHAAGNVLAVLIAIGNVVLRWDDPVVAVAPAGVAMSIIVALILGVTGWLGGEMSFHHGIGVAPGIGGTQTSSQTERLP